MGQPGGPRRPALSSSAAAIALVVAGAGLSLARQSGVGALNTVYAEDGSVFLASAYSQSTVDSLTTPYAGYLHTAPRLLSELVSLAPLSSAAFLTATLAALTTGLLALLVFVASRDHLPSLPARLLASAVVVLVPVGQEELPNSIANLHWPALYALFWVLLWKPASRAAHAVGASAVLLIAMSDLLAVVFVPLAAWIWWRHRSWHTLALPIGLAFQAAAVLFGQSERELNPEPVMWAPWWVIRAVPSGLLGQRWLGDDVNTRWLAFAAIAWLLLAAALLTSLRNLRSPRLPGSPDLPGASSHPGLSGGASSQLGQLGASGHPGVSAASGSPRFWPLSPAGRLAALAMAHCVAVYALPVLLSGQATPRYAAAPAMFLIAALAAILLPATSGAAVGRMPVTSGSAVGGMPVTSGSAVGGMPVTSGSAVRGIGGVPVAGVVLILLCAVVWAVNFRAPNERAHGPQWTEELRRAGNACASGGSVEIELAPKGWKMSVPCREVRAWR